MISDNRITIVVDGEQKLMLSPGEIISLIKQEIYDYVIDRGKRPTTIMMSIPVYESFKAQLVPERIVLDTDGTKSFMGLSLELIDSKDAFFIVGHDVNCKV